MYKCILFYTNKLIVIPGNTQNHPCALSPSVMSFKEKNVLADFGIIESIISAGNATVVAILQIPELHSIIIVV